MRADEHEAFRELMAGVHGFYGRDLSEFALGVWWQAMRPYDLAAVSEALSRHVVNPDSGQFMPKPADVVRMLGGRSVDSALSAWSKVDRAVRTVGTWASVAFDDPRIHRVIEDMGGWVGLGSKTDAEWPFLAREFENRYRGYAMRSETPEYPRWLIGVAEAQNARQGQAIEPPVLVGDKARARAVMAGGADHPRLAVERSGDLARRIPAASRRAAEPLRLAS